MHDATDKPEPDMSLLAIPAFLRRNKGGTMQNDEIQSGDAVFPDVTDPGHNHSVTPAYEPEQHVRPAPNGGLGGHATTEGEAPKPMEEMTLPEAQAKLAKMIEKRDALVPAITAYKKYIQKLIGQL